MADKDPHVTGAKIARRRHQLDLTQEQLAEALGVSPSTVANWERGASYPKRKLGKIEQLLGISLDDDSDTAATRPAEQSVAEMLQDTQIKLMEVERILRQREERGRRGNGGEGDEVNHGVRAI